LRATPKAAILKPLRHTITIQIVAQFSSSLSRYRFRVSAGLHLNLLMHFAEKILLLQPLTFGEDYRRRAPTTALRRTGLLRCSTSPMSRSGFRQSHLTGARAGMRAERQVFVAAGADHVGMAEKQPAYIIAQEVQ
jgi:hypothetical protein